MKKRANIRQTDFFEKSREFAPRRLSHGGSQSSGRRKLARPLDVRRPVHLVLKSSQARGKYSMLGARQRLAVARIVARWAVEFRVRIHGFENMGNHLHIAASFKHRHDFKDFLRTVSALIARAVTGARRGRPFGKRFWDGLAFTRVINGKRNFEGLLTYLQKNAIERELGGPARQAFDRWVKFNDRLATADSGGDPPQWATIAGD